MKLEKMECENFLLKTLLKIAYIINTPLII